MKIHFSNVNFSSSSGPNSFANRLAEEFTKRGHEIVGERSDYEIFLCFIEPASVPREGSKFIHRLDGIWFKPEQFKTHNKHIKWAYENCDKVIWQSNFDKKMTCHHWGKPKSGVVIHNGIKKTTFDNLHDEIKKIKTNFDRIFVCSAFWHRQKRLKENIVFYQKNRNKDWLLHFAWLDHCPNVVVESLSMGCPVICTTSGGTKEIVQNNGIILNEKKQYSYELVDYDNPYTLDIEKIDLEKINVNSDYLDIELVCDKYEKVFKWD